MNQPKITGVMAFRGLAIVSVLGFTLTACVTSPTSPGLADRSITPPPEAYSSTAKPYSKPQKSARGSKSLNVGDRVLFRTDSSALSTTARKTLSAQATFLVKNKKSDVTIEGHADERGTREYNLALGARRANTVRDYLLSLGVNPGRIGTISYGKERPVSLCSDESCWSQNRRAVTILR